MAAAAPDVGAMPASIRSHRVSDPFKIRLKAVPPVARSTTGQTATAQRQVRGSGAEGRLGRRRPRRGRHPRRARLQVARRLRPDRDGHDRRLLGRRTAGRSRRPAAPTRADRRGQPDDRQPRRGASPRPLRGLLAAHGDHDTILPDKSELPAGDEHASDSVADFMHTSWSVDGSPYGSSWSSMLGPGFTGYVKLKYPASSPVSRTYAGTNLTWPMVKAEIDAGRPMAFLVDATGDGRTDHFVAVIGYREVNGYPEYACWDTWSLSTVRWAAVPLHVEQLRLGRVGRHDVRHRLDDARPDPSRRPPRHRRPHRRRSPTRRRR